MGDSQVARNGQELAHGDPGRLLSIYTQNLVQTHLDSVFWSSCVVCRLDVCANPKQGTDGYGNVALGGRIALYHGLGAGLLVLWNVIDARLVAWPGAYVLFPRGVNKVPLGAFGAVRCTFLQILGRQRNTKVLEHLFGYRWGLNTHLCEPPSDRRRVLCREFELTNLNGKRLVRPTLHLGPHVQTRLVILTWANVVPIGRRCVPRGDKGVPVCGASTRSRRRVFSGFHEHGAFSEIHDECRCDSICGTQELPEKLFWDFKVLGVLYPCK